MERNPKISSFEKRARARGPFLFTGLFPGRETNHLPSAEQSASPRFYANPGPVSRFISRNSLDYGRGPEKVRVYGALRVRDGRAVTLTAASRNTAGYLRLLETIARANRVFQDKINGLIVDYVGVFRDLQKALAIYGSGVGGDVKEGEVPVKDKSELVEALKSTIFDVVSWGCHGNSERGGVRYHAATDLIPVNFSSFSGWATTATGMPSR